MTYRIPAEIKDNDRVEDDSIPEDHSGCVVFFIFGVIMFGFFVLLVMHFLNNFHM